MSLKAFHFFFIIVSVVLCTGFGVWCIQNYLQEPETSLLAMGIGGFATSLALLVYLGWFLKKLKKVSFLILAFACASVPKSATACAVCFGNPNSPLTKAANTGILFLLGVVGLMLVTFAGIFIFWGIRSRQRVPRPHV